MSKVCQRTQPLSCSRHKRNGCKAQAQAALPTMMSGLDGCLRADVTWVGSGEKEGESFHVCLSAAQCWLGTVAEQGSAWSASIYLLKSSVCLFVCLSVCFLSATRHLSTLRRCLRKQESSQAVAGGPVRAGKRMHSACTA